MLESKASPCNKSTCCYYYDKFNCQDGIVKNLLFEFMEKKGNKMSINGKKYNKNCKNIFFNFPVRLIALVLLLSFMGTPGYGFTRKLVADYSEQQAGNISHYVVLQKKNAGEWVRFEKLFTEACKDGSCTMELDLEPESEYAFRAFFKNAAGDGNAAQIFYRTGRVSPAENLSPGINAVYTMISDTSVLIQGTVQDASHVDLRISGNKAIQNFGYPVFNFTLDIDELSSILLEAEDIHGNKTVSNIDIKSLSRGDSDPIQSDPEPQTHPISPATPGKDTVSGIEENPALYYFFDYIQRVYAKDGLNVSQGGVYNTLEIFVAAVRAACDLVNAYRYYTALYSLNGFDESAYLADKLADLAVQDPATWGGSSPEDLRAFLWSLGMTPFAHYIIYGEIEGNVGPYVLAR